MSAKPTTNSRSGATSRRDAATFLSQQAREHDVKFIRIWFTDILGFLKSFAITIDELEKAVEEGVGVDGSSIESFARAEEHDMIAVCDPKTFQILPWRPRENAVARMFADIHHMDGRPFEGDPRHCLKRQLRRAAQLGFTFFVGPEIEFFYFKNSEKPEPTDQGGYFDLAPLDTGSDMRRQTVLTLEALGIPVHSSHHEVAPGQHEIDLKHMDALTMADGVMTYRLTAKEIALQHGVHATFMPKPIEGQNGSGMHVHQSLFYTAGKGRGERNAFYDKRDRNQMSQVSKHYVAGLLRHAREMSIVTNQWVNSYKRLVTGYEAPTHILWGEKNRAALVRIPMNKAGRDETARAEFRSPDPACNPYLAFSVMLAAGLKGIQQKLPLPKPAEGDVVRWTRDEKTKAGIEEMPTSLGEAIEIARKSKFLRETLGEHIHKSLIRNKEIEWENYRHHISQYELKKDLPTL
jgi:glutamine synthetase